MHPAAIAIITARGGSKGLPRKNVLPIAGRPLVTFTIEAALESGCFERVVVTTDDDEIADVSQAAGATVLIRPPELATDGASSLDVLRHALEEHPGFEIYGLLQPTSPLRTAEHTREAFELLLTSRASSCVSITPMEHPPQKCLVRVDGELRPLFSARDLTRPRQELAPTYRINGAIYLGRVRSFLDGMDLFAPPLAGYEMSATTSVDVDGAEDLALAERLIAGTGA